MEDFTRALADFVRDHEAWAAPIVLVLAFGESLAFISLLIPAWGALVAIGALIGVSGISFWPVWLAGGFGAALGDWLSYWFGFKYKEHVAQMWPLSRYPGILPLGEAFVKNWGVPSIFIGRFFGPPRGAGVSPSNPCAAIASLLSRRGKNAGKSGRDERPGSGECRTEFIVALGGHQHATDTPSRTRRSRR